VVAVEDGDTISVLTGGKISYQVRLQGIDAPEDRQPYFDKSRKHLSNLLLKEPVKAVFYSKDSNGRLIATVYQNGRDVGLMQIENGLAWHYKRFSYEQTAGARKSYADAQAKAVAERKGLWDDKKPIPPWVFRGDTFAMDPNVPVNGANGSATSTGDRKYILGPRGGCYYLTDGGAKVYVQDKSLCAAASTAQKP
jgi:endonuclease YncB( thermonuclease family)